MFATCLKNSPNNSVFSEHLHYSSDFNSEKSLSFSSDKMYLFHWHDQAAVTAYLLKADPGSVCHSVLPFYSVSVIHSLFCDAFL